MVHAYVVGQEFEVSLSYNNSGGENAVIIKGQVNRATLLPSSICDPGSPYLAPAASAAHVER